MASDDFDFDRVKPFLRVALADNPDNTIIWNYVYSAVSEATPPPRPIAFSLQQTPWLHNTSSFANSSEYRQDVDKVLRSELGPLYVGLPRFRETFFGSVTGLETASKAVFKKYLEGSDPLFKEGWRGWPQDANQDDVLSWFADLSDKLAKLAKGCCSSAPTHRRRPLAQPNKPIQGSTGELPGKLKSNPSADTASKAWLDLRRYAREVLAAEDTRRFVLGFTICRSLIRIWKFDRLGGIASEQFDINKDGLQFVSTLLGFLWINKEELGFDPTVITNGGRRYIEIEREG
ncbi:hypothetical protein DL768_010339 [Monosporascus sp. mg162]|nr:hypothetical protein DL768_010339 [Monosporascus sp. mg162]